MHLKRVENPSIEPLSLIEVKQHLRISQDSDDLHLLASLKASREAVENFVEISLISQLWEMKIGIDNKYRVELPRGPIIDTEQLKLDGKTLAKNKYPLQKEGNISYLYNTDYLSGDLYVRYKAGFGDNAADVPAPIRQALLLMMGYFYENRGETAAPLPMQVKELLQPYRKFSF